MTAATVDNTTLHNWLHHWQDEYDAAYLYLVLAGQEADQKKKEIYIKLAGVEERHTQMWEKLLAEHGHPIAAARARPTLNARLRAWFGRRFGPGYLLPLLLREEGQEVKGYMDLQRSRASTTPGRSHSSSPGNPRRTPRRSPTSPAGRASPGTRRGPAAS